MPKPNVFTVRQFSVRNFSLAAALALAAGAAQPACVVVGTCAAADTLTLQNDLRLTNGAVQKPGREPPSRYFCPDLGLSAAQAGGAPTPNTFELQFRDLNPRDVGNVRAQLMRKNRTTGAARELLRLNSSYSATVATVSTKVTEAWDLENFIYFVLIEMVAPAQPVEAHSVCLVAR
jgi:hypothetical protein